MRIVIADDAALIREGVIGAIYLIPDLLSHQDTER